jgi:hypothetical protein
MMIKINMSPIEKAMSCFMIKLYEPLEKELVALRRLKMPMEKRANPLIMRYQSRW